jgi:hypothetical protein
MIRRRLRKIITGMGYEIRRLPRDLEPEFLPLVEKIRQDHARSLS